MITLQNIPSFVRDGDPFWLTMRTDSYKVSDGVKGCSAANIPVGFGQSGDTIKLIISEVGYSETLTCGTDFRVIGSESLITYVLDIIQPAIAGRPELSIYYKYDKAQANYLGNVTIFFEARDYFSFDLGIACELHAGGVFTISLSPDGALPVYRKNFKINIRLTDSDGNFLTNSYRKYTPDKFGNLEIDINFLIKQLKKASIFPVHISSQMPDMTYSYDQSYIIIEYWESWSDDDGEKASSILRTQTVIVVPGGTSKLELAKYNSTGTHWSDLLTAKPILLSLAANERKILPGQPVFLKYLSSYNRGVLTILIGDGKSATIKRLSPVGYVSSNLAQADISPSRLGLASTVTSFKAYYESNGKYTDTITFTIDRTPYTNVRFFVFENSLGGWDTIFGIGIGKVEAELSRSRISGKALRKNFTNFDRESEVIEVEEVLTYKVNLGYSQNFSSQQLNWANYIRQLYMSKRVFEFIQGSYIPVDIVSKKQQLFKDEVYLQDYEIEYKRAFVEKNAPSEIPPLVGDYSDDYSDDYY